MKKTKAKKNTNKPTPLMLEILRLAEMGEDLYAGARGQSEHGGRSTAIYALKRRGLLGRNMRPTEEARAAMRNCCKLIQWSQLCINNNKPVCPQCAAVAEQVIGITGPCWAHATERAT